ncbi:unnamed protein product, partial [Meganyctiphanes norvegica]
QRLTWEFGYQQYTKNILHQLKTLRKMNDILLASANPIENNNIKHQLAAIPQLMKYDYRCDSPTIMEEGTTTEQEDLKRTYSQHITTSEIPLSENNMVVTREQILLMESSLPQSRILKQQNCTLYNDLYKRKYCESFINSQSEGNTHKGKRNRRF